MQIGKRLVSVMLILAISITPVFSENLDSIDRLSIGLPPFVLDEYFDRSHVVFGEFLFSKPLSRDGRVSCMSCHKPEHSFADKSRFSQGIRNVKTTRNSPPLINLYCSRDLMWDGRIVDLSIQPVTPLESHDEMDVDWEQLLRLLSDEQRTKTFLAHARKPILTRDMVIHALEAFVRSLVTVESRFDKFYYLGQTDIFTAQERHGLELFRGKANCTSCHTMNNEFALFTDNAFHVTGSGFTNGRWTDLGRYSVTKLDSDLGAFKTPTLRNVGRTAPYMHDGELTSIESVIEFYDRGGNQAPGLDRKLKPLGLTSDERRDLAAFLRTLDSRVVSYKPEISSTKK